MVYNWHTHKKKQEILLKIILDNSGTSLLLGRYFPWHSLFHATYIPDTKERCYNAVVTVGYPYYSFNVNVIHKCGS